MADSHIGALKRATDINDDSLFVAEQNGEAVSVSGAQFKGFAVDSVKPFAESAEADATSAAQSSKEAQEALENVQEAIENIPEGDTPIVNDLTTGGSKMALSAEQGKALKQGLDAHTSDKENPHGVTAAQVGAMGVIGAYQVDPDTSLETAMIVALNSTTNTELFLALGGSSYGSNPWAHILQGVFYQGVKEGTSRLQIAVGRNGRLASRLYNNSTGVNAWSAWVGFAPTDYALNKAGDTMTGLLVFKRAENGLGKIFKDHSASSDVGTILSDMSSDGTEVAIALKANERRALIGISNLWTEILHTGNKPSGAYTGNGSATERKITVGGIGNALLIWSNVYGQTVVNSIFGSKLGETPKNFSYAELHYDSGALTIASDHTAVNASGVTYFYQVL